MHTPAILLLSFLTSLTVFSASAQQSEGWRLTPVEVLNTPGDEYAPRMGSEGLLYSRSPVVGDDNVELRTELMYSAFRQNGLHAGRPFSTELSSPLHESSACLGPEGNFVVFSRNSPSKRNATNYLYLSRVGVHDFQEAEQLPFNDPRFNSAHPTLDHSGKRLLFSSDRPGGFGGFDLYYAEFKQGIWSKPINLGAEVNSKNDEIFPYWSDNNQITFSSNRPGGYGGLDLYLLDASQAEWKRVKHLGKPFSSDGDDHGLTWSNAHGKGFLASNRVGGKGGDDIYSFTFSEESPISWLVPDEFSEKLVILNTNQEIVASLDHFNHWKGLLANYPDQEGLDYRALANRLCGNFIEGATDTPDSITLEQIRVEVLRSDFLLPVETAVIRNPDASDGIVYRTDRMGGVCIPNPSIKQTWIIEKQGFGPQSVVINPARPFINLKLISNYPADSIVLRNSFETNRRISETLSDKVVNSISGIGIESGYQLTHLQVKLLSTQTPKTARLEAEHLTRCITKELMVHPSAQIESSGLSVFSDEGLREQSRVGMNGEARVEYTLLLRKIPANKGIGLNVD